MSSEDEIREGFDYNVLPECGFTGSRYVTDDLGNVWDILAEQCLGMMYSEIPMRPEFPFWYNRVLREYLYGRFRDGNDRPYKPVPLWVNPDTGTLYMVADRGYIRDVWLDNVPGVKFVIAGVSDHDKMQYSASIAPRSQKGYAGLTGLGVQHDDEDMACATALMHLCSEVSSEILTRRYNNHKEQGFA